MSDSPPKNGASTEECRVRWTDRDLMTLCEPLDPTVPEAVDAPGLLTLLSPSIQFLPNPARLEFLSDCIWFFQQPSEYSLTLLVFQIENGGSERLSGLNKAAQQASGV